MKAPVGVVPGLVSTPDSDRKQRKRVLGARRVDGEDEGFGDADVVEALGSDRKQKFRVSSAGRTHAEATLHRSGDTPGAERKLRSRPSGVECGEEDERQEKAISSSQKGKPKRPSLASAASPEVPARPAGTSQTKALEPEELPELLRAAERGDVNAIGVAIANGADLASASLGGYDALHLAAASGHAEAMKALLAASAEPDKASKFGQTPLHVAVIGSAPVACVELLLESRADVHVRDGTCASPGFSALELGLRCGTSKATLEVLKRAVEQRPAPRTRGPKTLPKDGDSMWALLLRQVQMP